MGVKARKYKCPAARPQLGVEVGWSRGASNPWGRSVKRIAAASLRSPTKSLLRGVLMANCGNLGAPSPSEKGEGQCLRGRNRIQAPAGLPGVKAVAPRKGSMSQSGEGLEPSQDPTVWQGLGV